MNIIYEYLYEENRHFTCCDYSVESEDKKNFYQSNAMKKNQQLSTNAWFEPCTA